MAEIINMSKYEYEKYCRECPYNNDEQVDYLINGKVDVECHIDQFNIIVIEDYNCKMFST